MKTLPTESGQRSRCKTWHAKLRINLVDEQSIAVCKEALTSAFLDEFTQHSKGLLAALKSLLAVYI